MSAVAAVVEILRGSTSVESIAGHKIYGDSAPQNAQMPYLVIEEVSGEPENAVSGEREATFSIVNVHGFSRDSIEIRDLQAAVRAALQDYHGQAGGIDISTGWIDSSQIATVNPRDGSELAVRHMTTTFNLWSKEP